MSSSKGQRGLKVVDRRRTRTDVGHDSWVLVSPFVSIGLRRFLFQSESLIRNVSTTFSTSPFQSRNGTILTLTTSAFQSLRPLLETVDGVIPTKSTRVTHRR